MSLFTSLLSPVSPLSRRVVAWAVGSSASNRSRAMPAASSAWPGLDTLQRPFSRSWSRPTAGLSLPHLRTPLSPAMAGFREIAAAPRMPAPVRLPHTFVALSFAPEVVKLFDLEELHLAYALQLSFDDMNRQTPPLEPSAKSRSVSFFNDTDHLRVLARESLGLTSPVDSPRELTADI